MFRFIQTSTTGIVETFGRFTNTLNPGLNVYLPFVQRIHLVSNRLQQKDIRLEVKTQENVFARLNLIVDFVVKPEDSAKSIYQAEDPEKLMVSHVENVVRALVPRLKLDDLFASQNEISESVKSSLSNKMQEYGFTVMNTSLTQIEPNDSVKLAMNKINESARLLEAAKNEGQATYVREIKQAEADRDRKRLQGEGTGLQRAAILKSFEERIDSMSKNLGITPKDILSLVLKIQHLDTLEQIGKSPNAKTVFLEHNRKLNFLESVQNDQ